MMIGIGMPISQSNPPLNIASLHVWVASLTPATLPGSLAATILTGERLKVGLAESGAMALTCGAKSCCFARGVLRDG